MQSEQMELTRHNEDELCNLKSCPFCGTRAKHMLEITLYKKPDDKFRANVFCFGCASHGPNVHAECQEEACDSAADLWNARFKQRKTPNVVN